MPPFPEAAHEALADDQLRANLRKATHTIRAKRAEVVAEVPDWEKLRRAGAAIKDDVLAHLPRYLEQLEASVTAAGGTVHWARDADEANAIVVDIARGHGTDEVVKIKSMATQEIGLNNALAEASVHAWETDLAELIVQLGHDLPSHILVPAIHRNRTEIRDIFAREMAHAGRPAPEGLTDRPADLAEAARRHLREKFLRAKVAVSGGNFAIAETGTVCVVESEGNGRMCLTLPDVLVTVLGIEKLLPAWRDMEVFLQLLPRSSTGERMNPYTSMWTGVTEGDGPRSFHLILLDNGRSDVLADPEGRQALRCIRCSACLNVCPVYERVGGHAYGSVYPGPIGAILTPQLRGINQREVDAQTASLPYASTLCGACFDACPVRIDIPAILTRQRAQLADLGRGPAHRGEKAAMRAVEWAFAQPWRLGLAQHAASFSRHFIGRKGRIGKVPRLLAGPLAGWTASRDAPAAPPESFRTWFKRTDGGLTEGDPATVRPPEALWEEQ
ncbi:MAG: iron-sulfur cluster-binding protein [Streptomycetaceae bacterium]|nr:iron-sulfur cluster-binding protein [Streptomycetaceae bacterium]